MFIPNDVFRVGEWIYLKKAVKTCAGTFTKGHEMKITDMSARGADLVDVDGNKALEVSLECLERNRLGIANEY